MAALSGSVDAAGLRKALLDLDKRRASIEEEAQAIEEELESPGPNGAPCPGVHSPLVDQEGFPRADIDVYNVRHKRHRLACLRTDHSTVMREIERSLHALHAATTGGVGGTEEPLDIPGPHGEAEIGSGRNQASRGSNTAPEVSGTASSSPQLRQSSPAFIAPFARIGEVTGGSPSSLGGIREGDELLEFGTVTAHNHRDLHGLADFVAGHVGQEVHVVVRRQGVVKELRITPARWTGRGVLGCHFLPAPSVVPPGDGGGRSSPQ